MKVPTV